jgi:hypothetical protein
VQNALAIDCWATRVLTRKYRLLAVLLIGTWTVREDVDSSEISSWPLPSIEKIKRGQELSSNVPVQEMTPSSLSLLHVERSEYSNTNPPARVKDFDFNRNPE